MKVLSTQFLVIEVARKWWEKKTPLLDEFVFFQTGTKTSGQKSFIILVRNYIFLKIYATSEGAVSHNVLYYQQLSNARYKVSS